MVAVGEQTVLTSGPTATAGRVSSLLRLIRFTTTGTIGASIVLAFIALSLLAPLIAPADPNFQDLPSRAQFVSWQHPLGTDLLGRDMLSRILYGSQISLTLGITAVIVGSLLGVPFGLIAGYIGRGVDMAIMRVVDVMLAFPLLLLAIIVIAILGPSLPNMVLAVGISSAPRFARLARGEVLSARNLDFVLAARALGTPGWRIVLLHILPNIAGPLIVLASLRVGTAILVEASLSFVGLGPQPPTPAWGLMIAEGREVLEKAWWVAAMPGIALSLVILSANMAGDWLRDFLDPTLRHSQS